MNPMLNLKSIAGGLLAVLLLIVLMIYRPQGLFGNKELSLKMFSRILGGGQRGAAENK